jgi:hypothetical protein
MFTDLSLSSDSEDYQQSYEYLESDIKSIRADESEPESPELQAASGSALPKVPALETNLPDSEAPLSLTQPTIPGPNDGGYHSIGSRIQALTLFEYGLLPNAVEVFTHISRS